MLYIVYECALKRGKPLQTIHAHKEKRARPRSSFAGSYSCQGCKWHPTDPHHWQSVADGSLLHCEWHLWLSSTEPAKPYTPQHFWKCPRNLPYEIQGSPRNFPQRNLPPRILLGTKSPTPFMSLLHYSSHAAATTVPDLPEGALQSTGSLWGGGGQPHRKKGGFASYHGYAAPQNGGAGVCVWVGGWVSPDAQVIHGEAYGEFGFSFILFMIQTANFSYGSKGGFRWSSCLQACARRTDV